MQLAAVGPSVACFPRLAGYAPVAWWERQLGRPVDQAAAHAPGRRGAGRWRLAARYKYDGYRMPARIDGGEIKLLTRTGLDWSHRHRRTIDALGALKVKSAYLDGELCALNTESMC
jgi:ATP-dependent DNA ligase